MKLLLPVKLFRAVLTCMAAVSFISFTSTSSTCYAATAEEEEENGLLMLLSEPEYTNGSITYTSKQTVALTLTGYESILFKDIVTTSFDGGAISNNEGTFTLSDNGDVTFCDNEADQGGAIYNYGTFTLGNNGDVSFCGNRGFSLGGAIDNCGTFAISGNGDVSFSMNSGDFLGGAIYNSGPNGRFILKDNGNVCFSSNTSGSGGGAIFNNGATFILCGNGNVTFSKNWNLAIDNCGTTSIFILNDNDDVTFSGNLSRGNKNGVIENEGTFTLSGNGNVLFEENLTDLGLAGKRFRSIYSTGILNLSATEGKSILFKDTIYASNTVNLNQEGMGDIIFSGATTAAEILNSSTSELATNAKLYGGRLIVEDDAILKGQGITITEGANATIRLNGGTLDETGYTVAVSSGSGLEFEGENTLAASAVSLADNSFLSFILDEAQTAVNWDANLDIQGGLTLNLTHDDRPVHETYTLLAMQSGNTVTGWETANLTINGASAEQLVWENNTLYYRPMLVQENGDTTLDTNVETNAAGGTIGGKDDVNINGNGHSLTVKNAVQLVQMALKNGTVKLEGENNNVVSVTLTEDGTLVLTAGAGLKTGDIISMVASGKGELVISGDITLDEHGMKGKNGKTATVSNMNATTTGDAVFENVAFTDSLLDIGEGTTATFKNAVLGAGTRVTDAPATAKFENTLALLDSTNTEVVTESTTAEALQLYRSGDTANAVTLNAGAAMVDLTCTVFDTITLSGSDLYLDLTALAVTLGDADAFSLTFTNGTLAAIDTDSLHIYATLDGVNYLAGYTTQQGGMAEKVYFATSASVPEPATATLSLLALAALAARRKRVA